MTQLTLQIEREEDLRLLLQVARRLKLPVIDMSAGEPSAGAPDRQQMIDFIMAYTNDRPSFGNAVAWQHGERSERELPWQS